MLLYKMIISFKDPEAKKIFDGLKSLKIPIDIQETARRKLRMIDYALDINDLKIPPANRLEKLKGNRIGQHSIRINQKWRVCFVWKNHAYNVEIVNYH